MDWFPYDRDLRHQRVNLFNICHKYEIRIPYVVAQVDQAFRKVEDENADVDADVGVDVGEYDAVLSPLQNLYHLTQW